MRIAAARQPLTTFKNGVDRQMFDRPGFESRTESLRLGAVVFTLRSLGWPIETIEIPRPTKD